MCYQPATTMLSIMCYEHPHHMLQLYYRYYQYAINCGFIAHRLVINLILMKYHFAAYNFNINIVCMTKPLSDYHYAVDTLWLHYQYAVKSIWLCHQFAIDALSTCYQCAFKMLWRTRRKQSMCYIHAINILSTNYPQTANLLWICQFPSNVLRTCYVPICCDLPHERLSCYQSINYDTICYKCTINVLSICWVNSLTECLQPILPSSHANDVLLLSYKHAINMLNLSSIC